jgi:hypothetical protein
MFSSIARLSSCRHECFMSYKSTKQFGLHVGPKLRFVLPRLGKQSFTICITVIIVLMSSIPPCAILRSVSQILQNTYMFFRYFRTSYWVFLFIFEPKFLINSLHFLFFGGVDSPSDIFLQLTTQVRVSTTQL